MSEEATDSFDEEKFDTEFDQAIAFVRPVVNGVIAFTHKMDFKYISVEMLIVSLLTRQLVSRGFTPETLRREVWRQASIQEHAEKKTTDTTKH